MLWKFQGVPVTPFPSNHRMTSLFDHIDSRISSRKNILSRPSSMSAVTGCLSQAPSSFPLVFLGNKSVEDTQLREGHDDKRARSYVTARDCVEHYFLSFFFLITFCPLLRFQTSAVLGHIHDYRGVDRWTDAMTVPFITVQRPVRHHARKKNLFFVLSRSNAMCTSIRTIFL